MVDKYEQVMQVSRYGDYVSASDYKVLEQEKEVLESKIASLEEKIEELEEYKYMYEELNR